MLLAFARMVVVKAAGRTPTPAPRRPDSHAVALAAWTGQLGKIGNLINQLARDYNAGFDVSALDVEELAAEVRKLRETILLFHGADAP